MFWFFIFTQCPKMLHLASLSAFRRLKFQCHIGLGLGDNRALENAEKFGVLSKRGKQIDFGTSAQLSLV